MPTSTPDAHPRPDLNRGAIHGADWISLDGAWEFAFEETGDESPPDAPRADSYDRRIYVPFPWQSHLAWGTERLAGNENWYSAEAIIDPANAGHEPRRHGNIPQYEVGWYRRTIQVPAAWAGKRVILHIGAADWHVAAWCNGASVGAADSGYLPVEFDITDALTDADNHLVIRVFDPMDHGEKPVGKQWDWYTRTSGIWQSVWLEPRPETHVRNLRVTPNVGEGSARIRAEVEGADGDANLRVVIAAPGNETFTQELPSQGGVFQGDVSLGHLALWTPETPDLYTVTATLLVGGQVVDEVHSYFGMRSVSVGPLREGGPNYILLNGEPVYMRGALDQSFNPWGVYAWPDDQAARRDVELAKEAGFNFLRTHIKIEDPRFLYWCDKLGMLLQCDLPNFGYDGYSDIARERHEAMLRRLVERDFNHPSIFSWCLFNETWGLGGDGYKQQPERHAWVESVYHLAKELDPTRLIEDNSPCLYDHVITDLNTWHFYINDYAAAREHIANVVEQTRPTSGFNFVPGRAQTDAPLMNSEYGGISAGMGDVDVSWCFRFLTTELRMHEKICGYIYTELQDIEWECNGVFNYDRTPKEFGYDPALLQREVFVGFDCAPGMTVYPDEPTRLPIFVSCPRVPPGGEVTVDISIEGTDSLGEKFQGEGMTWETGDIAAPGVIRGELPEGIRIGRPGLVTVNANITAGGDAWNCVVLEARDGPLPAVESLADGRVVLRKLAGDFEASSAWHEAELERGKVGEEQHLVAGVGSGHFDYRFEIPEELSGEIKSATVIFEASSHRPGAPQTSEDRWPSDLKTYLNGVLIDQRTLPDQPADSRGALSHMHGFQGRYGEVARIEIEGDVLGEVMAKGDCLDLRLEVPASARNRRGLTLYTSRAGSCPCDVTVVVR